MIRHVPTESKPTNQPPKAPAPLPIPDVQTHLGILRDLIYSGDRDALALHCLKHWPAFVPGDALQPTLRQYVEDCTQSIMTVLFVRALALQGYGGAGAGALILRVGVRGYWCPGQRVMNYSQGHTRLNRISYGLLARDIEASR
jgi:hypothetical protein